MSEYGYFLPQNTCACCGAGEHNKYQHHEHCLINLPVHTFGTIFSWKQGRKEFENPSSNVALPAWNADDPEMVAYHMGKKFARARANAECTLQSLEQAVEIAKNQTQASQSPAA